MYWTFSLDIGYIHIILILQTPLLERTVEHSNPSFTITDRNTPHTYMELKNFGYSLKNDEDLGCLSYNNYYMLCQGIEHFY